MRNTLILKRSSVAVAILAALVAVALFSLQSTGAVAKSPNVPVPPDPTTTVAPPTAPVPPTTTVAPPTTLTPPTTVVAEPEPDPGTFRLSDKGPGVLALQQRLRSLGYWLGSPDGTYSGLTLQAVMAFQKVEEMERDGIAGPATTAALAHAGRPEAASASGDLIEVDKKRQILFVVRGGTVSWVLNTSTGTEAPYQVDGRTEMADTPAGHWQVAWAYDGVKVGELGALYRPRYFHADGIAVHGYRDVPAYPASHGCVRVSNAAMDWIWAEGLMPIGSPVWVQ